MSKMLCNQRIVTEAQMHQAARAMAAEYVQAGQLICMHGTLGMGKSSFCRAFLRAACNDAGMAVPSPTFTLVQPYHATNGVALYHADLYRLETAEALDALGFWDMMEEGCVLVEWPELLLPFAPENTWHVRLEASCDDATRLLTITQG